MIPDLPALGVRFDVNRIESSSYGVACWKVFWDAIDPKELAGAVLYEGDTAASMSDRENVFCIAVQTSTGGTLGAIRAALSSHARFNAVCSPPRFVDGAACTREPLVRVGSVTVTGEILGDAWNARPALEAARARPLGREAPLSPPETAPTKPPPSRHDPSFRIEKQFTRWDYEAVQELERLCNSLPVLARPDAVAFFDAAGRAAQISAKPVERQSGRIFEGLTGVVSASDRHDFAVSCELAPGSPAGGILTLETFDDVIGVLFCAARVSERSFLTYAFPNREKVKVRRILDGR